MSGPTAAGVAYDSNMCSKAEEEDDPYRRLPVRAPLDEPPKAPPAHRRFQTMWHFARTQGA